VTAGTNSEDVETMICYCNADICNELRGSAKTLAASVAVTIGLAFLLAL